jgi:5-methylcytosine-specific restriction enzyme subunit McrC
MPQIPIQNLYYILCYAWKYLDEGSLVPLDVEPSTKLVNLFAKVLLKNVGENLRYSIHREYSDHRDDGRSLRGKFDISMTVKRMLLPQGRIACEYTDLSVDTDINRIIKATLLALSKTSALDDSFVASLQFMANRMGEVSDIFLAKRSFQKIHFNRGTDRYRATIKICELIFDQLIPKDEGGSYFFHEFIRDEKAMRRVFEDFIRNFYELEQKRFPVVRRERLAWQAVGDEDALNKLPMMETDTSLINGDHRFIIETKYYPEALKQGRAEKETVRSGHLYQLASYLENLRRQRSGKVQGLLLYPAVNNDIRLSYEIWGIPVSVRSLNLNQDWQSIHEDLLEIVEAA